MMMIAPSAHDVGRTSAKEEWRNLSGRSASLDRCNRSHNNEEVEMVVRERLRMKEPDLHDERICFFNFMPKRNICVHVLGGFAKQ
jgi:cell division protein FtsL